MSTFATLMVLPSIFALVIGRSEPKSPSLYPGNRASAHYDPQVGGGSQDGGENEDENQQGGSEHAQNGKAVAASH